MHGQQNIKKTRTIHFITNKSVLQPPFFIIPQHNAVLTDYSIYLYLVTQWTSATLK